MHSALGVTLPPASIDIFCRVIDNYGDIGVCWRLACNLLQEMHQNSLPNTEPTNTIAATLAESTSQPDRESKSQAKHKAKLCADSHLRSNEKTHPRPHLIRLWVDDLKSFARIVPSIVADQAEQLIALDHLGQILNTQSLTQTGLKTAAETINPTPLHSPKDLMGWIQIHAWHKPLNSLLLTQPSVTDPVPDAYIPNIQTTALNTYTNPNAHLESNASQCNSASTPIIPAPICIEAFACELDPDYIATMPGHTQCWFNLEYLSAEDWVASFHAQPSRQSNGVAKYFFFPGFTTQTGGLLREADLLTRQKQFLSDQQMQVEWLQRYISAEVAQAWQHGARLISYFSYPHAPFEKLISALLSSNENYVICIPRGVVPQAEECLARLLATHTESQRSQVLSTQALNEQNASAQPVVSTTQANDVELGPAGLGTLTDSTDTCSSQAPIQIHRFEFIEQYQFDYLLSISDFNVVRGEDSFVRAIWAAKPFIWHIYPQEEQVHLEKLQAWLMSYPMPDTYRQLLWEWNVYPLSSDSLKSAPQNRELSEPSDHKEEPEQSCYHENTTPLFDGQVSEHALSAFFQNTPLRQEWQAFALAYRDFLEKNPTLSFSLLNFQPNSS